MLGADVPLLGTGAGHDAGILAAAGIPTAMLFVRNPTGISHSPAEYAERDDCLAGVEALAAGLAGGWPGPQPADVRAAQHGAGLPTRPSARDVTAFRRPAGRRPVRDVR